MWLQKSLKESETFKTVNKAKREFENTSSDHLEDSYKTLEETVIHLEVVLREFSANSLFRRLILTAASVDPLYFFSVNHV